MSASVGTVKLSFNDLPDIDAKIHEADEKMMIDKKKKKAGRDYVGRPSFRQRLLGEFPYPLGLVPRPRLAKVCGKCVLGVIMGLV